MTEPTPDPAPLAVVLTTVRELSKRVVKLTKEVELLRKYGRRSRKWLVVDIILTVAVFVISYLFAQQHSTLVAACQAGNVTRTQERGLWGHLYKSALAEHPTPAQLAADRTLIAYVNKTFANRDCAAVYRPHWLP